MHSFMIVRRQSSHGLLSTRVRPVLPFVCCLYIPSRTVRTFHDDSGYNSPPVLMSVVGPAVTRQPKPWSLCANQAARSGHAACFAPDSRLELFLEDRTARPDGRRPNRAPISFRTSRLSTIDRPLLEQRRTVIHWRIAETEDDLYRPVR